MGRVVVVGSLNVDHIAHVESHAKPGETLLARDYEQQFGGKGANQAVAAAAAGADVLMVGCVGDDSLGESYAARLAARGIDTSYLTRDAHKPTGAAYITVDESRENIIIVVPGANDSAAARWLDGFPTLQRDDVVLLSLEIPLTAVAWAAERAHEHGARVVINIAPYAELPSSVLALADPIVANEHEALQLADSGAGVGSLLVTMGGNGAVWDGLFEPAVPLAPEDILDTTGAGDAFVGALCAALAAGADRAEAMRRAAAAGAAAVGHRGAQPPVEQPD